MLVVWIGLGICTDFLVGQWENHPRTPPKQSKSMGLLADKPVRGHGRDLKCRDRKHEASPNGQWSTNSCYYPQVSWLNMTYILPGIARWEVAVCYSFSSSCVPHASSMANFFSQSPDCRFGTSFTGKFTRPWLFLAHLLVLSVSNVPFAAGGNQFRSLGVN